MKISEVIEKLQEIQNESGDLDVIVLTDVITGYGITEVTEIEVSEDSVLISG